MQHGIRKQTDRRTDLQDIRLHKADRGLLADSDSRQSQGRTFLRSDTHRCDYTRLHTDPTAFNMHPTLSAVR